MTDQNFPSEPGRATTSAETVTQFEAEEMAKTKRKWQVSLHPGHLALLPAGEAQPYIFFREDFFNKLELMPGMGLLALKTPIKAGLKLTKSAAAQLSTWFGRPNPAQLAVLLKRRYALALPIAILLVLVSMPLAGTNTVTGEALAFSPLNFGLGLSLIALWALSKLRPQPILFLLDSAWFLVIAIGHTLRVCRSHHWWALIWSLLLLWLAISGVKRYRQFNSP
jgi:hypothetical protein